ncbi:MAG: hypothetical protein IJZ57_02255 [Clostridia bacterium]|nr:hypothetical protein [Clostridia bacterium]
MKDKRKSYKVKLISKKSIITLVGSLIICLMFLFSYFMTVPIEKESCKTVTTAYEYSKMVQGKYLSSKGLHIYCSDSKSYYIGEFYLGNGLTENIESIEKGADLTMTVSKADGEIVEISTANEVLLSYSDYTEKVERERKIVLSTFFLSLVLPIVCIVNIYKQKNRYNS